MSGHCFDMTRLQILFLLAVPLCSAQFRIQGPSDGNRRAQGLKYDNQKGIEYDDQRASLGTGDFTIQGASDGNSAFNIQGASDGNSDFQIHGATDGRANYHIQGATDSNADFQIQGATDGNANYQNPVGPDNSQSIVPGPYDLNQGSGRALQYRDPSGLRVNWKSYQNTAPAPAQAQEQVQAYAPAPAAPAPRRKISKQYQPAAVPQKNPNFKVFDKAPPQIQQLLQFQQQIPYLSAIPQQYRYDFENAAQAQAEHQQSAPAPQEEKPRASYRGRSRGPTRQKRQAQKQRGQPQPQRISQPVAEPQPNYQPPSSRIQELLKFQAQIPYVNHIPEPWRYDNLLAQQGVQPQPQYQQAPAPQSVRHSQRVRQRREAQHQQQQQQPQYNTNIPGHLQQLLQFQAQAPYTSIIPQQFRYDIDTHAYQLPHRPKRQAPQYQHARAQPEGQVDLSQYRRISQPPAEALPQYSPNIPGALKQLLQFQSQAPYDIIANRINVRLDKPYVPQPVQAPAAQYQATHQPAAPQPVQPQYQPQLQRPVYQPAPQSQPQYQQPQQLLRPNYQPVQPQQPAYPAQSAQYPQLQQQSQLIRPQYHPNQIPQYPYGQNGVRPVNENQY